MSTSNDSNNGERSYRSFFIIVFWTTVVLNICSWKIPGFSDAYTMKVFPFWVETYGKLTSKVPFSVGEIMIIAGLAWLVLILFSDWIRKRTIPLLLIIALVMTLNCFINYHCTPIKESFEDNSREFSVAELSELRDAIVIKCNELSEEIQRDENGVPVADEEEMMAI